MKSKPALTGAKLFTVLNGGGFSFLGGKGDGTFSPADNYQAGSNSGSLAPGDFNNDGKLDFALSSQNSNEVNIVLTSSPTPRQI